MAFAAPVTRSTEDATGVPLLPPGVLRTFLLIAFVFLLWGIPANLNDVLIRQFMKSFELNRFQAGLVQFAYYFGYFVLALPAGMIMRKKGYKVGFMTGLITFGAGCLSFPFAANSGRYSYFLAALFVIAMGLSFLETAANPFMVQLGPTATSERRLNIAQTCNSLGSILAVVVGNLFIFSGIELTDAQRTQMQAAGTYADFLHKETLRIAGPYVVLGVLALVWAGLILVTKFPKFLTEREHDSEVAGNVSELLKQKHFLFALFTQFMYVGAQVGSWSYVIQYAHDYVGAAERTAGWMLTGTLVAFALGRVISSFIMKTILPSKLMAVFAGVNIALVIAVMALPGWVGLYAVLASSFFMSLMFPTIFSLGLKDLGPNTNVAASLLVMMIVGGAIMPPVMGLLADNLHSTALSYIIPLAGYIVVLVFSVYMTRYRRQREALSTFPV